MERQPIRYFVAVATELHMRRAAERLNLSQPALSRAIQQLERHLGFRLLDRTTRRLSLTPAGHRFLKGSQDALATLDAAAGEAADIARGRAGQIAIGYTDIAIAGRLPRLVQRFRESHPGILLSARHGSTKAQLTDLSAGRLDVGFLTGPLVQPGIASRVMQTDRFVVLLATVHPLARRRALRLDELRDQAFVMGDLQEWTHFHVHFDRLCHGAGFRPNVVQYASNNEGISGLVACGVGISIQAESSRNYLRDGIAVRPLLDPAEPIPTVAAWARANASPVIPLLLDVLG